MLSGLAVAAAAYFTYMNIFVPKMDAFDLQKKALSGNTQIKSNLDRGMVESEQLEEKVKAMQLVVEEIDQSLPNYIHQENVILYIRDVFARNNIEVASVGFSEPGEVLDPDENVSVEQAIEDYMKYLEKGDKIKIREYSLLGEDEKSSGGEDGEEEQLKAYASMGVNVSFSGMYSDLKNMLKEIEQNRKKIIIKSIALNNTAENITGSISLEFPFYPDGNNTENTQWDIESEYGNIEPFVTGRLNILEGTAASSSTPVPVKKDETPAVSVESDFYIVLKPISSDMPTVTMGKSPYRYTAVYEDSNMFKEANIHIKKEGEAYMFRYNTSSYSYPAAEGEFEQMKPMGQDIVINVYSMIRLNEADSSGLVLNVYNDTDKAVKIYVSGDDASNPRFKVNTKSGVVESKAM